MIYYPLTIFKQNKSNSNATKSLNLYKNNGRENKLCKQQLSFALNKKVIEM